MSGYLILSGLVGVYALVASRVSRAWLTGPIVFAAVGLLLGTLGSGFSDFGAYGEATRVITGATLALLLFSDASNIGLHSLREDAFVIALLLLIGFPLTVALGTLAAVLILPTLTLGTSALLASILAPTDLSLGLAMFKNPRVPTRVRRTINVESGLNDGIAAPLVTLFLAVALAQLTGDERPVIEAVVEIVIGLGVGVGVGLIGGFLTRLSRRREWSDTHAHKYAALGFALLSYTAALALEGNGFIAAFVGGISFGALNRSRDSVTIDYAETTGVIFSLVVWFVFGSAVGPLLINEGLHWQPIVYALASLTVVRSLAVMVPLRMKKMHWSTVLFVGWFGPRGLASVTFLILAIGALKEAGVETTLFAATAGWTILLSVLLHGLSATPAADWYGSRAIRFAPGSPELEPVGLGKNRHGVTSPE